MFGHASFFAVFSNPRKSEAAWHNLLNAGFDETALERVGRESLPTAHELSNQAAGRLGLQYKHGALIIRVEFSSPEERDQARLLLAQAGADEVVLSREFVPECAAAS